MDKEEIKREVRERADNSDWMKYVDIAQSIAFAHGMQPYEGQTIGDWLDDQIDFVAEEIERSLKEGKKESK